MAQQSPLLDQYNQDGIVTPLIQRALDRVREKLPQFQLQPPAAPGAAPLPQSVGLTDATRPRLTPPGTSAVPTITRPAAAAPATPAPAPARPAGPTLTGQDAADQAELNRLKTTGSGITQVHNPIARGLLRTADIIGSTVFPRLTEQIPGTEYHHDYLVHRAQGNVDEDVKRAQERATTAETEAKTGETQARTSTLLHPKDQLEWAESAEPAIDPEHPELGPQHFFYNKADPSQRKFGGTMAARPTEDKQQENTHVLPDGSVIAVHNDPKTGKSTAEVLYQGKPAEKPGHVITRLVEGKLHNILIDAETGKDRADLGETRQPNANVNDHGVTMIGKDGKVYRLEPGQTVPEGAQTPTQVGSVNTPTTQQRNVAGQAQLVHEQTPYMLSEIDRLKDKLGPMAGRWNEVMQGKLGMNDPDFAGLRADLLMYSSAVALMHARGRLPENLREEFDQAINNPAQNFANLKAVITKIDNWTVKNPGVKSDTGGGTGLPGGISLEDINAEIERRKKK